VRVDGLALPAALAILATATGAVSRNGKFVDSLRWREPDSNFWSLNHANSAVLTSDAMAGISVVFVFDAHLA
jgi:hypothetical protein